MHIVLLAAGFGTRLGEFGKTTPKGLIAHGESTLVGKLLTDVLALPGISIDEHSLALTTNARFINVYTEWLRAHIQSPPLTVLNDGKLEPDSRNGAIGDIMFTLEALQWWDDDLLVLPSDTYYEFALADFVGFARNHEGFSTVLRDMGSIDLIKGRLGCAVVEGERIIQFVEKPTDPPSTFAAIPFYFYPKHILAMLPDYQNEGGNMDAPGSIIPWLLSKNVPVFGYVTNGKTLDVGTTEDVLKLSKLK